MSETAVTLEAFRDTQKLSGFIHLWHYFVRAVAKSVFGCTSTEMCLPLHSAQWPVTAVDIHYKYARAASCVSALSHAGRLSVTQLSALGRTRPSSVPLARHDKHLSLPKPCAVTKLRILPGKVLLRPYSWAADPPFFCFCSTHAHTHLHPQALLPPRCPIHMSLLGSPDPTPSLLRKVHFSCPCFQTS